MARSLEVGKVPFISTHEPAESLCVVDAVLLEELQMLFQQLKIVTPSLVGEAILLTNVLPRAFFYPTKHAESHVPHRAAVTNQRGEVWPKGIWEIVDAPQHALRLRDNRPSSVVQHPRQQIVVLDQDLSVDNPDSLGKPNNYRAKSRGQTRYFLKKQTPEYFCVCALLREHLVALLLGNALRVFGDLCGAFRCFVRSRSNPDSAGGSPKSNYHGSPIRDVPPIDRKRAHSHHLYSLSMLEPILS
ncbi:hypothetical protein EDF77_1880 [Stenotrophomonas maltophilia]|nr:hypothetical protein EDF77_1880 [Stenotrophomonas maltophilia]